MFLCVFWFRITKQIRVIKRLQLIGGNAFDQRTFLS